MSNLLFCCCFHSTNAQFVANRKQINKTRLSQILIYLSVYRQFRLCITNASGKTHTPIILIILYHTLAEKARMIFRLRRSDMIATAIVILKPYGFSDILFATKLAQRISLGVSRISLRSNTTRRRRIKPA